MNKEDKNLSKKRIFEICTYIGQSFNSEIFVDLKEGIPPLINDIKLVPKVIENEIDILCENNIIIKNQSSLGAEDFTYFLEKTRGVFFNLGYSNKKLNSPIHASTFNIYEN